MSQAYFLREYQRESEKAVPYSACLSVHLPIDILNTILGKGIFSFKKVYSLRNSNPI